MILRTFLSLLCAIGLAACASPIKSGQPISSTFGAATKTSLSRSVRLLDWNVHKGTRTRFGSEFARLTRNADVIVLQEMSTHGAGCGPQGAVPAISGRSYVMAHAIRYRDGFAGCANGATANAVRSKVHEFTRSLRDVRARAMLGNGSDHTAIELTFRVP